MHFFNCPSSQGQYIRRHDHIRDAIIVDQIGDAIRPEYPYDIGVEREPLVRAHLPPAPPGGEEAMEVEADNTDARLAEDSDDIAYIEEMQRPYGLRCPSGTCANATKQTTRPPGSAVETLGCIPTAPASSWMWLWGMPLHPPTASPRRYQMSPRTPRRMPPLLVGDRVNTAAARENIRSMLLI